MFGPNQLLRKNHKIYCRNAQLCTRSTVLALDTRSTVLKFQNNRASKSQKRCSHHPLPIFLEKWQNSSKVTEMNPFLSSTKAKKFFFHQSHNCNPFKITVSSTMMLLPGAQKQSCPPVRPSAKRTLSPSSTTSSGHHVKTTVRKVHGVQGLSAFTTVIRPNFGLKIHRLALSNHLVKPA